jgi:lipoyl(octanoyl) transferase
MQRWKQRELFRTQPVVTAHVEEVQEVHCITNVHDGLLLLEHPSVYTLGRRSTLDNLRFDHEDEQCPYDLVRVERGGEVTWHGPGQLVGYPIMSLARGNRKKDLHWFLRQIEQVIINVLEEFDLEGVRDEAGTGVWVGDNKVAAIGLSASKWVTMHGFSLNVAPDFACFEGIVPCGIEGRGVTSLQQQLDRHVEVDQVAQVLMLHFAQVFQHEKETVHQKTYPECHGLEPELFTTLPLKR